MKSAAASVPSFWARLTIATRNFEPHATPTAENSCIAKCFHTARNATRSAIRIEARGRMVTHGRILEHRVWRVCFLALLFPLLHVSSAL